jgi:dihydrofolate synthase/folylpolyglutamate synthase
VTPVTVPHATLADWLQRLERFSPEEIVLGLERVRAVLGRLSWSPPARIFTVAGTNGKGSTVAMTAALLAGHGEQVGTYTSPHLIAFNERIAVAGKPLPDEEIVAAFEQIEKVRGDVPLTYFQYGTLAAMLAFNARNVDVAVLEVGMGGRLDAVNVFEPTAVLITNVALDHCAWLGSDVETIAVEKAGVMRRGKPVVFGAADVPQSVLRIAAECGAKLLLAGRDFSWQRHASRWSWQGQRLKLENLDLPSLPGSTQVGNAAAVLAMLEAAGLSDILRPGRVNAALSKLTLPGRMQSVVRDRHWLFDVAHNPAAMAALASTLSEQPFDGLTVAVLAMLDDKDVAACVAELAPHVDYWIAFTGSGQRAIPAPELARMVANAANTACLEADTVEQALAAARRITSEDDRVLVTGSFHSVGPALAALRL